MVKPERLAGRSIFVTGGTGAIGSAIILRCVQEGAVVTATSRNTSPELDEPRLYRLDEPSLHRLDEPNVHRLDEPNVHRLDEPNVHRLDEPNVHRLVEPNVHRLVEPNVHWIAADVRDARAIAAALAATVERTGSIDVVINSAGVQVEATVDETTDEQFDLVVATNLGGVFNCCRAAVVEMKRQGGGSIINIGSTAAFAADHHMAVYNASKAAVHALTRSVAIDHGHDGIRCNAVAPGWIRSAMADAAFDSHDDPERARRTARHLHPVGRLGSPEDVANVVAWLASDEASFVSGSVFTVDGGLTAQNPIQ